jgi:hypothetical protein
MRGGGGREEVMIVVIPLEGPIDVYHPKNNMNQPKHKHNDSCIKDTEKATNKIQKPWGAGYQQRDATMTCRRLRCLLHAV